jgi:hypothetical protein
MVDLTINLGRNVATATQVFSVIRAELRVAIVIGLAMTAAKMSGQFDVDPDFNLQDGGDLRADIAVFNALVASALQNVVEWARDMELVFDKEKVTEFIRGALADAMSGMIDWGEVDY